MITINGNLSEYILCVEKLGFIYLAGSLGIGSCVRPSESFFFPFSLFTDGLRVGEEWRVGEGGRGEAEGVLVQTRQGN
jgi:hypothetical protein